MDHQTVALMIPIVAMMIPVVAIVMGVKHKMAKLQLEEARVRHGDIGEDTHAELDELRGEVEQLRSELGEVHERLDFAERLLANPPNRAP
jgi:hypothetical protein